MPKRIIISGGGTGGHIFPAVAIANKIREEQADAEILFVGALGKMEMEKVPEAGYKIIGLPIAGLQRRLTWKNLSFPFKLIKSLWKAKKIIKDFKPDIAIGVGGYASGPLLRAASKKKVKTLIQEQNSFPGITNKILSKKVHTICVAYDGMDKWFPKEKIVKTGNPVRSEVVDLEGKKEESLRQFDLQKDKTTVLVVGGSLGARTLNHSIGAKIDEIAGSDIQFIWQTGKSYFKTAFDRTKDHTNFCTLPFIKRMDYAYSAADIIISRAGAMSISELSLIKKPCILVPSPNVSEDHQTKNAMALVNNGAAILVKDDEAKEKLVKQVFAIQKDQEKLKSLTEAISKMGMADATEKIYQEITKLLS